MVLLLCYALAQQDATVSQTMILYFGLGFLLYQLCTNMRNAGTLARARRRVSLRQECVARDAKLKAMPTVAIAVINFNSFIARIICVPENSKVQGLHKTSFQKMLSFILSLSQFSSQVDNTSPEIIDFFVNERKLSG